METRRGFITGSASAMLLLWAPAIALAEDVDARLVRTREVERYKRSTPHSKTDAGCARAAARASVTQLERVVTDFDHYDDHIKRMKRVRVVGRDGDRTHVYMEVPILKGAAKIWARMEFLPPQDGHGGERVIMGRMLEGNVDRLDATWRIRPIDDVHARLDLELLILPDVPAPASVVTSEVAGAAGAAVKGCRRAAEDG